MAIFCSFGHPDFVRWLMSGGFVRQSKRALNCAVSLAQSPLFPALLLSMTFPLRFACSRKRDQNWKVRFSPSSPGAAVPQLGSTIFASLLPNAQSEKGSLPLHKRDTRLPSFARHRGRALCTMWYHDQLFTYRWKFLIMGQELSGQK